VLKNLHITSHASSDGAQLCWSAIRLRDTSILGASLLKPSRVREVLADGPERSFETDQITSAAAAPLLSRLNSPALAFYAESGLLIARYDAGYGISSRMAAFLQLNV
jgi:hypothetical protein